MKYKLFLLLFFILPILSIGAVADNFIYPVSTWDVGTQHGDLFSNGLYHMGTDACFQPGEGAPVYASANGVVKEAQERTQFGLVVLIEHSMPNGSKIVSLYGHLKPSDKRVHVGQTVSAGDLIGVLGNSAENGGWSPHIHFGIHKSSYTGVWVYSGHVSNPATADQWYDAEDFIPEHLTNDKWNPEVSLSGIENDAVVDDYKLVKIYATDIGSTIDSVYLKASDDGKNSWTSLGSYSGYEMYPYSFYASFYGLEDGEIYLRAKVTDEFGNSSKSTIKLIKKNNASTTKHLSAMKGLPSSGNIKTIYQDGYIKNEFTPYKSGWDTSGDIAIGDVTGNGSKNIITINGEGHQTKVKIYSTKGSLLDSFKASSYKKPYRGRITTGDLDGDGKNEIIIGSGSGMTNKIKVYNRKGTLKWSVQPYKKDYNKGIDVASCDIDGDGKDEIITGLLAGNKSKIAVLDEDGNRIKTFRAFGKNYKGGTNVACGDIDDDGLGEIIVGSGGDKKGQVKIFESNGKEKKYKYTPFGKDFKGAIDVAVTDWEQDGKDEIIMSQASNGEAWVKTYRYSKNKKVLTINRLFEEGFEGGARVAGW